MWKDIYIVSEICAHPQRHLWVPTEESLQQSLVLTGVDWYSLPYSNSMYMQQYYGIQRKGK